MSKMVDICPTLYPYIVGVPGPQGPEMANLGLFGNLERASGGPQNGPFRAWGPILGLQADFGPFQGGPQDPPFWAGGPILGPLADPLKSGSRSPILGGLWGTSKKNVLPTAGFC